MMETHTAIIVQPDERRGASPPAAEKGVQHKFVERVMAAERRRAIPRRIFLVGVEERPVFRDADFRFAPGENTFAPDDAAGLRMGAGHVVNHAAEFSKLPLVLRRKTAEQIGHAGVGVWLVESIPEL